MLRVLLAAGAVALAACGEAAGAAPADALGGAAPARAEGTVPPATPGVPPAGPLGDGIGAPAPVGDGRRGPPYPVVLAHGMGGFAQLGRLPVEYFHDVVEDLRAAGEREVFTTEVPPYASTEVRARALADQIDAILARTGRAKVNLVGHSQGGLDARVVASPGGLARGGAVASVTTVSTPHRGTYVADAVLAGIAPGGVLDEAARAFLGFLERSVYDAESDANLRAQLVSLSERHMADVFNPRYVDDARVAYASYAGRSNGARGEAACAPAIVPDDPSRVDDAQIAFAATGALLARARGVNDGVVTVDSARWGAFVACVPADHGKEIGQPLLSGPDARSGFSHKVFFRAVVARLRAQGL